MPETASPIRRIAVEALLADLLATVDAAAATEAGLAEARGAVLAETVTTAGPLPAVAFALADGRGVIAAETTGASPYVPAPLSCSLAVAAGDSVPPPFDAVARTGEAEATTSEVALPPGADLRRIGEDAVTETILLRPGQVLGSRALAVAAAAGRDRLWVRRGRALIAADAERSGPLAGVLADFLAGRGMDCRIVALAEGGAAAATVDLAVFLGGAAIGATDPAWRAVSGADGWRAIGRPALRPGETIVAGRIGRVPTLVVPARLDDLTAAGLALIDPSAAAVTAVRPADDAGVRPLSRKLVSAIGFSELALFSGSTDGTRWEPLAIGTIGLAALARAESWALLPPESEGANAGTPFSARFRPEAL
jgi:molybdopterin biosynthesis enzyme